DINVLRIVDNLNLEWARERFFFSRQHQTVARNAATQIEGPRRSRCAFMSQQLKRRNFNIPAHQLALLSRGHRYFHTSDYRWLFIYTFISGYLHAQKPVATDFISNRV